MPGKKGSTQDTADQSKEQIGEDFPPRLLWQGKTERDSFQPPVASLDVYERIDPGTIIGAVCEQSTSRQGERSLLEFLDNPSPQQEFTKFYHHENNWSNRLIAGDSLLVMNSLLNREGLTGQVQMIYFDPPYGIDYSSSFRPFTGKRTADTGVNGGKYQKREVVTAYKDTWELGIHSYLNHLWKRFLLARELLTETGSIFVQISDENVHLVRVLLDEVFGRENFIAELRYQCRTGEYTRFIPTLTDNLLWYGKDKTKTKYHQLFYERPIEKVRKTFNYVELTDGTVRPLTKEEKEGLKPLPNGSKLFKAAQLSQKSPEQIKNVIRAGRSVKIGQKLYYKRYASDFPLLKHTNHWTDTLWSTFSAGKVYAVQTHAVTVARCLLMTTDPGDLVLDPTCGSGTTAFVAEQWARRWITCDTSRVAISVTKQRLLTAVFDYYELASPEKGVTSGFKQKVVPHITLATISRDKDPIEEILLDQPRVRRSMGRISGPFTAETLLVPVNDRVVLAGEDLRRVEWCSELLRAGIIGMGGEKISFSRVEPLADLQWLHARAEIKETIHPKIYVSFGPDYAPVEQKQVELAINEAKNLAESPDVIIFVAFQFSPLASKAIEESCWPGVSILEVQMNADLLIEDLAKGASDECFWLTSKPELTIEKIAEEKNKGKYRIELRGLSCYSLKTGKVETSSNDRIVTWMLDPNYDGKTLAPKQVFIPMNNPINWSNLAKHLNAEIDEELLEAYKGKKSLEFETGVNMCIAVKIIDDRGLESLKIINLENHIGT
ncbi:MAG: site-specific DNA-methyltransferase [Candidatus Odinarchaeota archaeon]